jgi:hypothetical protein
MTDNTVDLDAKRKAKAPKCEICAGPVHEAVGYCPRVESVTQEVDGARTYHLWPLLEPDEPEPDVAG